MCCCVWGAYCRLSANLRGSQGSRTCSKSWARGDNRSSSSKFDNFVTQTRSIDSEFRLEYALSLNMHTQDKQGMSNEFLTAFMHAAREITSAERGLAVDNAFN